MLYKKKEFADLCGIPTNALAVYVQRNKVILSGDYVDDSIEQNRDFLKKRQEKLGITAEVKTEKPSRNTKSEYKEPTMPVPETPNVQDPDQSKNFNVLDKQKKALDIKKV